MGLYTFQKSAGRFWQACLLLLFLYSQSLEPEQSAKAVTAGSYG